MYSAYDTSCEVGFPIRTSADQRSLASPRGFSQRATSFIASWRQGIHRTLLSCSRTSAAARAQDQTAPGEAFAPPGRPSVAGTAPAQLHALANSHTLAWTPGPPPRRQGSLPGQLRWHRRPPDPIHRLKEHAQRQTQGPTARKLSREAGTATAAPHPGNSPNRLSIPPASHGGDRIRTDDPLLAKQVLYQLSYAPVPHGQSHSDRTAKRGAPSAHRAARQCRAGRFAIPPGDFFLPQGGKKKWAREDLNLRPHAYQACALTN